MKLSEYSIIFLSLYSLQFPNWFFRFKGNSTIPPKKGGGGGITCYTKLPKLHLSVILDLLALVLVAMDSNLYASLVVDDCSMSCVCENTSMSVYPHNCDAWMLLIFLTSNSWKKRLTSFIRIWVSYFVKMMIWLLSSINPTNWLRNIKTCWKLFWKNERVWIWTWMLNLFCLTNLLMS